MKAATSERLCDDFGRPGEAYAAYYSAFASNCRVIVTGHIAVCPSGRAERGYAYFGFDSYYDSRIAQFRRVTAAVFAKNPTCVFLAQLSHCGRYCPIYMRAAPIYGLSAVRGGFGVFRRPNSTYFYALVPCFIAAAHDARLSGFSGIQLHAAHGYLLWDLVRGGEFEYLYAIAAGIRKVWEKAILVIKVDAEILIKMHDAFYKKTSLAAKYVGFAMFLETFDIVEVSAGNYSKPNKIIGAAAAEKLQAARMLKNGDLIVAWQHYMRAYPESSQRALQLFNSFFAQQSTWRADKQNPESTDTSNDQEYSEEARQLRKQRRETRSESRETYRKNRREQRYAIRSTRSKAYVALTCGYSTIEEGVAAVQRMDCDLPAFGRLMVLPAQEQIQRLKLTGIYGTAVRIIGKIIPLANAGPYTVWYQQNIKTWAYNPKQTPQLKQPRFFLVWWILTCTMWAIGCC